MQAKFDEEFGGVKGIGMDPMGMIIDIRLDSILMFQQHMLPMPVDDIVDGFLKKAHAIKG